MDRKEISSLGGKAGAKVNRKNALTRYYEKPLYCLTCGKILKPKKNRPVSYVRRRRYCGKRCRTKHPVIRINCNCFNCGKKLKRRRIKENDLYFCNNTCCHSYRRKVYIARWKAGLETGLRGKTGSLANQIKHYLFEVRGRKCEICGWKKKNKITKVVPVEITHIDGNYLNNNEKNLKILCPNCHSLTPTYRGLNIGKGRPRK